MKHQSQENPSQLRRYLIPALVLLFLAASLSAFFLLRDNRSGSQDASEVSSQTDVTVEAGAQVVGSINADDLPLEPGMEYIFASNLPGREADVDFTLEGPWDFSDGPEQLTFTMSTVNIDNAPQSDYFNDASVAVYSVWPAPINDSKYSFQSLDEDSWQVYGNSGETGLELLNGPSRAMVFPASVGDTWVDNYQQVEAGRTVNIRAENRIISFNTLDVPAGTFDAYLLQIKVNSTSNNMSELTWDYVWLAPGIGRAAEIISLPGETEEIFDRAYAFYRLEQYGNA